MIRCIIVVAAFALVLGGCTTYDSRNRQYAGDGSYRGTYDGGYYAAAANGYGDYYYDRPVVVFSDAYDGFGGPYAGFGFGARFGYGPWFYNPWYVYGYPYNWYRPWPRHHATAMRTDVRSGAQSQSLSAPAGRTMARVDAVNRISQGQRWDDGDARHERGTLHGRDFKHDPRVQRHKAGGWP